MKEIVTWKQGPSTCEGILASREKYWDEPAGERCLGMAIGWGTPEMKLAAAIIEQLFPERACHCGLAMAVIHFNNHPDTTEDQVRKVLHTLELEMS